MAQKHDLDSLHAEIGYMGRAQIFYITLILFITFYTGVQGMAYVFTASDLNYRCYIDECDNKLTDYNPAWLKYAVPFDSDSDLPEQCNKYIYVGNNSTDQTCTASDFDNKFELKCDKFVYENGEETILREFDLTCKTNKWKLTLPGTMHNVGLLANLLIIGYISDRFGRKTVFIISAVLAAVVGIIQTFAWNYSSYVVLKFLESFLSGGTYSASVVLAIEFVSPPHRGMASTIIFMSAALGNVFLGFTAMLIQNWKIQTFANFIPSFVAIAYIWIIPESLQWLMVKGRYKDIADILLRIIKWNKVIVSSEVTEILTKQPESLADDKFDNTKPGTNNELYPIWDVFKSPPMLLRIAMLSYCWITTIFLFFGLSLISVSIGGNKFTSFMIVNTMDIPACTLVIFISHRVGRKKVLCPSFILSGISLLIYPFVTDWYWLKMTLFMIGKFTITVAFSTIYIFTSEMVPTSLRHTLIGVCSAVGRIGSIIAPQAPLLDLVMKNLPIFLFGGTALVAGIISFNFPETLNTKLPATIKEALDIGKKVKTKSNSINSTKNDIS